MNKEQLEKLSDFELSAMILLNRIGYGNWTGPFLTNSKTNSEAGMRDKNTLDREWFDINNWSDMGQLIEQNKINLNYFEDDDGGYYSATSGEYGCESHENECDNKNPLRAAAIVYLLMQGE